ncbi:MAG: penicillin-binding protein activator, partial [Halioglobus sp.]|nr:penicillin-binding protein activator [Halioglobus sp.]
APAGRAVLDGFLAAHYAARKRGEATPDLMVLDESDFASSVAAYEHAVSGGADIVIGPLTKLAVAELGTQLERPVPVLALNRTDGLLPASGSPLVQLSLAPEEEAAQLADYAFGEGARQAVILSPRDAWGDNLRAALSSRWQALGGRVVASSSYVDEQEYSPSIERALGLTDSNARAQLVQDLLGTPVESTPRRRQDADVVFLLARNSAQAKALKPLLAFHYAGDLPVYATSSAYSGVSRPDDRDLRGIRLLESPWLLEEQNAMRTTLNRSGLAGDAYPRLNALGADAYLLQAEFPRLAAGPDALLRGSTGLLSMDPQLHIQREMSPATFDGDTVRPR